MKYDEHKNDWPTFDEFVADCRDRFSDQDFQSELIQEIHRRTQGDRKFVAEYMTCMLPMFDRLSPKLTEEEEVCYAYRNLLPGLHLSIQRSAI